MKKFAAGLLTVLCATALATAQDASVQNNITATNVTNTTNITNVNTVAAEPANNDPMPIDEQPAPAPKKSAVNVGARVAFMYGNLWGFKDLSDGFEEPSGFGGEIGVAARFDLVDGLQFSPEISFRFMSLNHEDDGVERSYGQTDLDFSFFVRGVIGTGLFLEVGPQISINTSNNYEIDGQDNEFENIQQASAEFGINFGAGYYILDNLSFNFRWYTGFTEVFPDVKYFDDLTAKDYDGSKVKSSVKWSTVNLKGAHTMMFKFGFTYWFL